MFKLRRFLYIFIVLSISIYLWNCASSYLQVPVTRPAEVNLTDFNKIAIGEISGNHGEDLAEEITSSLFQSKRFEVLDRQNLTRLMKEHNLDLSGMVDTKNSAEIGKFVGAAALVFGRVSNYDYKEEFTSRDWETKSKKGKVTRHTTYTRKGVATIEASLQITDLTTGKILAIKNFSESNTKTKEETDEKPGKIDSKKLLNKCRKDIVNKFMKMIAPYQEIVKVKLLKDSKMPELERGISMAKIGEWKEAKELFQKAVNAYDGDSSKDYDKAWYDLAIAYKYTNEFDLAEEAVKNAYKTNPDEDYAKELKKIRKAREQYEKLQEQMN